MNLLLKTLPVLELPCVYHVGTLNASHKGVQGHSQEGAGLSVSLHPDEWTYIARLGGNPTFELTKKGGRFLDRHHVSRDTELRLKEWGIDNGWLQECTRWKAEWYDSEADCRVHMLLHSEAAALAEVEGMEDVEGTVTGVVAVILTPAGVQRLGFDNGPLHALDMAITFFVEDRTALDGVWWDDKLDPMGLSAPRGVISVAKLSEWQSRPIS
jgi:hypothetical protein